MAIVCWVILSKLPRKKSILTAAYHDNPVHGCLMATARVTIAIMGVYKDDTSGSICDLSISMSNFTKVCISQKLVLLCAPRSFKGDIYIQ